MMYTIEVWQKDARKKEGKRLVFKQDYERETREAVAFECAALFESYPKGDFEVHETFVTKKNLMTGAPFQERYDTPYSCSPSSETFWSS